VTPRIGWSNAVRPMMSAQIRKVSRNTPSTPAPFIQRISLANNVGAASVGAVPVPERRAAALPHGVHVSAHHVAGGNAAPLGGLGPALCDVRHAREPLLPFFQRQLRDDRALCFHGGDAALVSRVELARDAAAVLGPEL